MDQNLSKVQVSVLDTNWNKQVLDWVQERVNWTLKNFTNQ